MNVTGKFDVTLTPTDLAFQPKGINAFQTLSLKKSFHGPLNGESQGQMVSARMTDKMSAGYVAIEEFVGSLNDHSGSFILQHFGVRSPSEETLILQVLPNSGTDELSTLRGNMEIKITDGVHSYNFNFEL